jgi:hypothetical protein
MNKGLGVAIAVGAVVLVVSKAKGSVTTVLTGSGSPLTDTSLSATEALAKSNDYLDAVAKKYSDDQSLTNAINQAKANIELNSSLGVSPAQDSGVAIFNGQLNAYAAYRADGGTASFQDFSIWGVGMNEKYEAIIEAEKQASLERDADEIIRDYGLSGNLEWYINQLDDNNPMKAELLSRLENNPDPIEGKWEKSDQSGDMGQIPLPSVSSNQGSGESSGVSDGGGGSGDSGQFTEYYDAWTDAGLTQEQIDLIESGLV